MLIPSHKIHIYIHCTDKRFFFLFSWNKLKKTLPIQQRSSYFKRGKGWRARWRKGKREECGRKEKEKEKERCQKDNGKKVKKEEREEFAISIYRKFYRNFVYYANLTCDQASLFFFRGGKDTKKKTDAWSQVNANLGQKTFAHYSLPLLEMYWWKKNVFFLKRWLKFPL